MRIFVLVVNVSLIFYLLSEKWPLRVVFHWAEFSAWNDIFFCLLTSTLRQLVFKQKKYVAPRGKFRLVENSLKAVLQGLRKVRIADIAVVW